jgi:hypothetical protein
MSNKVAYLITYISFSYVCNNKGTIDESLLEQFILDEVSEFIINNSCSTKFELVDDIIKFWERYGGYNVWEAYYVKDNNWINIKPSNEAILLNIYDMTRSLEILEENEVSKSLDGTLEIVNISQTLSEIKEEDVIFKEEDIEIDWNKILNQEQEQEQEQEMDY